MPRSLKVDFFRVEAAEPFDRLLREVAARPAAERNLETFGAHLRMQEAHFSRDIIEGDMIRIRMDDVPLKASLSGPTALIDLEEDEGIGEDSAFLYYLPYRVLLLQRNRPSVSAASFSWYFRTRFEIDSLYLDPILRTDILQKLQSMRIIRKFDVNIAGVDSSAIFRGQVRGINSIIDMRDEYQAPIVSINMSMGKRRGSLSIRNIMETITSLLRISHDYSRTVRKLNVVAQEDYDANSEVLDILRARIEEQIAIGDLPARCLTYEVRRDALREAWGKRRRELAGRFNPRGE